MLAMVQALPYDILDTKWFPYEHQGKIGEARFLWSILQWFGQEKIRLCAITIEWISTFLIQHFQLKERKIIL